MTLVLSLDERTIDPNKHPWKRPVKRPANDDSVAVLFSGGLDSAILVGELVSRNYRVWPLFVDFELRWQPAELEAARRYLRALRGERLEELTVLAMPLADLYDEHWSITGRGTPLATDPDENVYLPGHNPLLLVKAQVWCRMHGVEQLALASLASNPFADATDEFFGHFQAAMDLAVSGRVRLARPFARLDKVQVMRLGRHLPLELTLSCLAPCAGLHCGACNKCAERQRAFRSAGLADRTRYEAAGATPQIAV